MAQIQFEVPGPGTYTVTAEPDLPELNDPGYAEDALSGKEFLGAQGKKIVGSMPNNPPQAVTIQGGGSYTIPKGYHSGTGTVTSAGSTLPTLTSPAAASDIVNGKQAIDQEGNPMTGTMPSAEEVPF